MHEVSALPEDVVTGSIMPAPPKNVLPAAIILFLLFFLCRGNSTTKRSICQRFPYHLRLTRKTWSHLRWGAACGDSSADSYLDSTQIYAFAQNCQHFVVTYADGADAVLDSRVSEVLLPHLGHDLLTCDLAVLVSDMREQVDPGLCTGDSRKDVDATDRELLLVCDGCLCLLCSCTSVGNEALMLRELLFCLERLLN